MDTGTARTTWETRGTHTPRPSRERWCTSASPHCCGHIIPSRLPGFRPPEPRTPHVQRAPSSCNKGSQSTNTHERTRASHTSTRTDRDTRTARLREPQTRLSTCTDHAFRPRSCATGPTTALRPHQKPNRCQTIPKGEPEIEGGGRAPAAQRRIFGVSAPRGLNRCPFSISPLIAAATRAPRDRTTDL